MLELLWPWAIMLLPLPWLVWRFWPAASTEEAALRAPFFETWQELQAQIGGKRKVAKRGTKRRPKVRAR